MISQPLEYDADEMRCDTCGQPTPRLTPLRALDVCDDCHRIAVKNEEIFDRAIKRCFTDGMQNPLHGWGEDTGK